MNKTFWKKIKEIDWNYSRNKLNELVDFSKNELINAINA